VNNNIKYKNIKTVHKDFSRRIDILEIVTLGQFGNAAIPFTF
jgi:hypothetical protein